MTFNADALINQNIDGYLIEKLLGEGGMARVYRARDTQLDRYVALKVVEPNARGDAEYRTRFEREARAVAQLEHPNIVQIYRFGEAKNIYYMVMQYIEGTDLGWLLMEQAQNKSLMQFKDILRIITDVSTALDYAHGKGVIHRDVKPPNIMLDKDGRAIVTDFGLALVQAEGTRGEIFGTPHYVAPEQAISSAGAVPQSDQYALGVILYEMLTGSVPYMGKSAMAIAMAHMTEALPNPMERNPDLTPAVASVLEKVLSKEPQERFTTCSEMAAALDKALHASRPSARVSMMSLPDHIQAYRAAHPLPPIAAVPPTTETKPAIPAVTDSTVSRPKIELPSSAVTEKPFLAPHAPDLPPLPAEVAPPSETNPITTASRLKPPTQQNHPKANHPTPLNLSPEQIWFLAALGSLIVVLFGIFVVLLIQNERRAATTALTASAALLTESSVSLLTEVLDDTAEPTQHSTNIPSTTAAPTETPRRTDTPTLTPTMTATPTTTPSPTITHTETPIPTATPLPTDTAAPTLTPPPTATAVSAVVVVMTTEPAPTLTSAPTTAPTEWVLRLRLLNTESFVLANEGTVAFPLNELKLEGKGKVDRKVWGETDLNAGQCISLHTGNVDTTCASIKIKGNQKFWREDVTIEYGTFEAECEISVLESAEGCILVIPMNAVQNNDDDD